MWYAMTPCVRCFAFSHYRVHESLCESHIVSRGWLLDVLTKHCPGMILLRRTESGLFLIDGRRASPSASFATMANPVKGKGQSHRLGQSGVQVQNHRSRLETRAKDYSMCASLRVPQNLEAKRKQSVRWDLRPIVPAAARLPCYPDRGLLS